MSDKSLWDLVKDELRLSADEVEVGFFPSAKYADSDELWKKEKEKEKSNRKKRRGDIETKQTGEYVAKVAYNNEYGLNNAPPRPFMRQAAEEYGDGALNVAAMSIASGRSLDIALLRGGAFMESGIKKVIKDFTTPPNSEATIEMKGSSHPLIDTGHMRRSVTSRLKGEG